MATIIPLSSRCCLVLLVAGALGCSGELLLPDPPGGGENVQLSKVPLGNGDNQEGTVGEQLLQPVVVQVRTPRDLPATGRRVAFVITSSSGDVSPDTAVTNSQGQAIAVWVLGTAPGAYVMQARLVGGEDDVQVEEFTALARPAAPDTLSPSSVQSQPGRRGHKTATAPVVRVVDRYGNAVPDVPVVWQVTAGEGQTSQPLTRTGADGIATVEWTLGSRIGVHKLTASIESATGSPATFTATVLF